MMNFIEIFAGFIECLLLSLLLCTRYNIGKGKYEKLITAIFVLTFSGVMHLTNLYVTNPYITEAICVLIPSITFWKIKNVKLSDVLSITVIYFLIIATIDFLLFFIISIFIESNRLIDLISLGTVYRYLFIFTAKFTLVLLYVLYRKISSKYTIDFSRYSNVIILLSIILYVMQNIGLNAMTSNSIELLKLCIGISWIMSLFVIIFVLMFLYQRIKIKNKEMKYEAINLKNDIIIKNLKDLTNNYKDMAQTYHDYNNQLSVIYGLISKNKNNDALEYIKKINKVSYNDLQYINTPFEILNTVLNNKIGLAKKNNINIEYDIDIDKRLVIPQNDMATILYNLLDNAIEANLKIKECKFRKIYVKIKIVHSMIFVIVENTINEADNFENNNILSRGYGLNIVEQIAEKYNGMVDKIVSINQYKICVFFNNINR